MPTTERTVEFEVDGIKIAVKVSRAHDATEKFLHDTLFLISPEIKSIPKSEPIFISRTEIKDMSIKMRISSILHTNSDFNALTSAATVATRPEEASGASETPVPVAVAAPASALVEEPKKRSLKELLPEIHDKILDIILFQEKGKDINSLRKDLKYLVKELKNAHYQQEDDAKFSTTLAQLISDFRKDYEDAIYAEDFNISANKNFTDEITEALKKAQPKAIPRAKPAVTATNSSALKLPKIEDLLPSTLKIGEAGKFKNLFKANKQGSEDTYLALYTSNPNYQNLSQYISKLTDDINDLKKFLEFCSDKFRDKHLKEFATTQHHNANLLLHKTSTQYAKYLPTYINMLKDKIKENESELKAARNDRSKRDNISGQLKVLRKELEELPKKLEQIKKWLADQPEMLTEAVDQSIIISAHSSQPTVSPAQPDTTVIAAPSTPEYRTLEQKLREALAKRRVVIAGEPEQTDTKSTPPTKRERSDSVFGEDVNRWDKNDELTAPLTPMPEKQVISPSPGYASTKIPPDINELRMHYDPNPTKVSAESDMGAEDMQQASINPIEHSELTANTPPSAAVMENLASDQKTQKTIKSAFDQILKKLESLIAKAENNNSAYQDIKEPAKILKDKLQKALENFNKHPHDINQLKKTCNDVLNEAPKQAFNQHRGTNVIFKFIRELLSPIFQLDTASTKVMNKFRKALNAIEEEVKPSDNQGKSPR